MVLLRALAHRYAGLARRDTEELKKYFPTSDLITGTDILFFWVARMMMMQLSVVGQIPFKTVYLHGLGTRRQGQEDVQDPPATSSTRST